MIITDDVYGTFVDDFQTVYSVAPKNTLLVYSYSKLFGATGWRLGVIGVSKDNVFDKLIAALPQADKQALEKRYSLVVLEPEKMKFIDRMVAFIDQFVRSCDIRIVFRLLNQMRQAEEDFHDLLRC